MSGRKSRAWWAVIKGGSTRKARLYKGHTEADKTKYAPIISIQRAPIWNDGERKTVWLNLWELDAGFKNEGDTDDHIACFAGDIVCKGRRKNRRFYFEPNGKEKGKNPIASGSYEKVGPPITIRFEAPGGKTTAPFPVTLSGDEVENDVWELGLEIVPAPENPFKLLVSPWNKPTSRMCYPIKVDGWTSLTATANVQQQCVLELMQLKSHVEAAKEGWEDSYRKLGAAYKHAFQNFEKAVKDQEELNAARRNALIHLGIGVAAGILTGGISYAFASNTRLLGIIGRSEFRKNAFNALEDTVQTIVGKSGESVEAVYLAWDKADPTPKVNYDPIDFEVSLRGLLSNEFKSFYKWHAKMVGRLKEIPLEKLDLNDPKNLKADIEKWRTNKKYAATSPKAGIKYNDRTHMTDNIQDMMEIGLWAEWLPSLYKREPIEHCNMTIGHQDTWESPGNIIEKRLTLLGISDQAKVTSGKRGKNEHYGLWTYDSEVKKLISWAKKYKKTDPKKFG